LDSNCPKSLAQMITNQAVNCGSASCGKAAKPI
jgi:hypothetical protein